MAKGNKVIYDNVIEDKIFNIGKDYATSLNPAIDANKQLLATFEEIKKSALGFANLQKEFKGATTNKGFLETKKKEKKLYDQTTIALKEQEKAEKNLLTVKARQKLASESTNQQLVEERVKLQVLNKEIRRSKLDQLGLIGAYQKLNKLRTDAKNKLADLLSAEKVNVRQVRIAQREYEKLNKRVLAVDRATDNYTKNIGNYKSAMKNLSTIARNLAGALGAVGGAYAVFSVFKNGIKIIKDFDSSMQNLSGILRTDREDLSELEQVIIDTAATSVRSATDVAKLAESLVTLGKTKEEVKQLLQPVNDLSIALGATSEDAGEFLVQTLNAFGKGVESAKEYADIIATIRTSTSLNFQKMRDSFQYISPISKILNKDLAYTGAIVGILADNGLKAESSGRLLATANQKLAKSGLTLNDALDKINKASANGVKETELLALATGLFGVQGAKVGIILANNSELIDKNAESIRNNKGALKDLVDQQLLSLSAHLDILKSKWESYVLNTDKATGSSNQLKKGIKFLGDNLEEIISSIITVTKAWITYKVIVKLASIQTSYMTKKLAVTSAIAEANAIGVSKMSLAWSKFNKVLKANAIGIAIAILTGAIYLFNKFNKSLSETAKEISKTTNEFLNQRKAVEKVNSNISTMSKRYEELKKKTKLSNKEQSELNVLMIELSKSVPIAVAEIDEYGRIISINTDKITAYTKEQKKLNDLGTELQLKKNIDLLNELQGSQDKVTDSFKNNTEFIVEGVGRVKEINGEYVKLTETGGKIQRTKFIPFNEEDQRKTSKYLSDLAKNIKLTKKRIADLDGTTDLNKLRRAEQEYLDSLTKNREEASKKQQELSKKDAAARKKLIEQARKDFFQLHKFRLEQTIKFQTELTANEENGEDERYLASLLAYAKKIELAKLERDFLLDNDSLTANSKLLIEEKYQAKLKTIQTNSENEEDTIALDTFIKNAEIKRDRAEKNANDLERIENELFKNSLAKLGDNQDAKEKLIEEHEQKIAQIKKDHALQGLNDQVKAIETLLAAEILAVDIKAENERKLSELKKQIGIIELGDYSAKEDAKIDKSEFSAEKILDISQQLTSAITELTNAIFDSKIANIDAEIERYQEYYDEQIELAGDDAEQKALLEDQAETKRKELENKKRKEQRKQAIYNKALSIAQIGISTAQAIIGIWRDFPKVDFGATAAIMSGVVGALGATQLAAAIATPIPKYALGTDWHPGGPAIVGEGKRPDGSYNPEVVNEPNKKPYIIDKPTLLDLPTGTKVSPDIEDYDGLFNHTLMDSIRLNQHKIDLFNQKNHYKKDTELINEVKGMRQDLKRKQPTYIKLPKVDIEHAVWSNSQIDWP